MKPPPPTAEQLDHLIGHTDHRALTAEEHALLRASVRALRASLAGTGAALRRAPSGAYVTQLRQQAARADRYRAAWLAARRRAAARTAPDDTEWDPAGLFTDDSEEWPLDPPPRPVVNALPDLADYQP